MTALTMPAEVKDLDVGEVMVAAKYGDEATGVVSVSVVRYENEPLVRVELSGMSGWADLELLTRDEAQQLLDALTTAVRVATEQ